MISSYCASGCPIAIPFLSTVPIIICCIVCISSYLIILERLSHRHHNYVENLMNSISSQVMIWSWYINTVGPGRNRLDRIERNQTIIFFSFFFTDHHIFVGIIVRWTHNLHRDWCVNSKDSHSATLGWPSPTKVCIKRIWAVQQPSSLVLKMLECLLMPGGWAGMWWKIRIDDGSYWWLMMTMTMTMMTTTTMMMMIMMTMVRADDDDDDDDDGLCWWWWWGGEVIVKGPAAAVKSSIEPLREGNPTELRIQGAMSFAILYLAGWWFGCHFLFAHILGIIIPIDVHIFQRGGPTTNQI